MTARKSVKTKSAIGKLVNDNATLVLQVAGGGKYCGSGDEMKKEEETEKGTEETPLMSAEKLNKISLVVFPAAFILCNVAYWVTLHSHRASKFF